MRIFLLLIAAGCLAAQTRTESSLIAMLARHPQPAAEAPIRLQLLRIYERRGDWTAAAGQLEHLRQLAPEDVEYAYQLGAMYGRISKASFDKMRALAPASARVQQVFGEQYSITGETARAIEAYRLAIAADPKLEGSHAALAMLYFQDGKLAEALAEIESELSLSPESAMARKLEESIKQAAGSRPR